MKQPTNITRAVIQNRYDCCQDQIVGANAVFASPTGTTLIYSFAQPQYEYILDVMNNHNTSKLELKELDRTKAGAPLPPAPKWNSNDFVLREITLGGHTRNEYFSIGGVYAYNGSTKLDLSAGAVVTSNLAMDPVTTMEQRLVDENIDTWGSTKNMVGAWFKITLKKFTPITRLVIQNRQDCCQDRIVGAQLIVSSSSNVSLVYNFTQPDYEFILDIVRNTTTQKHELRPLVRATAAASGPLPPEPKWNASMFLVQDIALGGHSKNEFFTISGIHVYDQDNKINLRQEAEVTALNALNPAETMMLQLTDDNIDSWGSTNNVAGAFFKFAMKQNRPVTRIVIQNR